MRKLLRFLLMVAVVLAALVGIARATAIRWWRVPVDDPYLEASIAPTLRGGDLIILLRRGRPMFGDLVLCPEPGKPERVVIGRIAGVEGQTVEIKGTRVYIDGRRAGNHGSCRDSFFSTINPANRAEVQQTCEQEELGSRVHMRGNVPEGQSPPDVKLAVGVGQILLLSDNRLYPYDSRDFGLVDRETCTERVVFRLMGRQGFEDVESRLSIIH
jgi:signal peptidase I